MNQYLQNSLPAMTSPARHRMSPMFNTLYSLGHGCARIGISNQPLVIRSEWLEMWQRLLTVDLMACFVHAFTLQDFLDVVFPPPVLPPDIVRPGWRNCVIPIKGDVTILYHSEPCHRFFHSSSSSPSQTNSPCF